MPVAVVFGWEGKVGDAFTSRLHRDGYEIVLIGPTDDTEAAYIKDALVFDCSLDEPHQQVNTTLDILRELCGVAKAVFIPTSHDAFTFEGFKTELGKSKTAIFGLAKFYDRTGGTKVVTDRIGYFPGDGVEADPAHPLIGLLVDGETLYSRVMAKMGIDVPEIPATH